METDSGGGLNITTMDGPICFNVIIPFYYNMIRVKGNPVTTVDQFED